MILGYKFNNCDALAEEGRFFVPKIRFAVALSIMPERKEHISMRIA
jgi:hypothetical protein